MITNMKLYSLFCVSMLCCITMASAQDPIFSQFYASPLQINSAFTGSTLAPRIALNYRDQWRNVPNAYATFSASYDQFIEPMNSGFGITLMNDQAGGGIYQNNSASINYAYRLQTRRNLTLKIGVDLGLGQSSLDWDKLVFLDMIDPINGSAGGATQENQPAELYRNYVDFGTGFVAYTKKFYIGLGIKHINSPNTSVLDKNPNINTGLPIRYALHAGYEMVYGQNKRKKATTYLTPNILVVRQGPFGMINAGVQGGMNGLFGGVAFRHAFRNSDAVILNVGLQKGIFKVGYSHDVTVNRLSNSWGAHELSLLLNFDELYDRSKPDYNDCFKLFR